MIIEDVMDDIGTRLTSVTGLNVLPYEADSITPPCATVSLPTDINYLSAYQRGMDKLIIEVTLFVSLVDDRVRRHEIAPYADGSGTKSIKQILETGSYTAFDYIAVRRGAFSVISLEDIEYLGAVFTCDIGGQGG